ncbi:MAG: ABC transporter ATP-binding protein [Chlamydiia bacterium]|nr:ABC transporter ATP-binding protein [Chlamydiia bacterium]
MEEPAVVCRSIKKKYGHGVTQVTALRGIDLEVRKGELLMVVGPSGCGKTTLLSIISAILSQDSGECLVYGHNLQQESGENKTLYRGQHIGFVFQAFNLIPMLNGIENVSIPLILNGVPSKEAAERSKELLIRVGLKERIMAFPSDLSGGEQQRVAIARSCIHNPKLIVCDEPTSALDHQTGIAILELFKEIVSVQQCALIIVTHDQRIFEFADRILKMDDGKIIGEQRNGAQAFRTWSRRLEIQ